MVRPGTFDDVVAGVALGRMMHDETGYAGYGYDDEKVANVARSCVADEQKCWFVAEQDGELTGQVGAFLAEHWFSRDLLVKDYVFYVRHDKRGGRTALLLMNALIGWAAQFNVKAIVLAVSPGADQSAAAEKFYSHYGFERIGGLYRLMGKPNV